MSVALLIEKKTGVRHDVVYVWRLMRRLKLKMDDVNAIARVTRRLETDSR